MALFFLTFFLVYGGVHLFAFLRARAAFAFGLHAGIGIGAFMLLMIFAPFLIRLFERLGAEALARFFSYTGYIWLGLLFLFFSASLALDACRLLLYISSHALKWPSFAFSSKAVFLIPVAVSVIANIYGYFEARNIKTEHVTVKTAKLPEGIEKLRIVQISDVHVGLMVKGERLRRIVEAAKAASPDMLVSTGDLVDGQINSLSGVAAMFNEINPRFGKYAITGNHEFYAGLKQALAFTEACGFRLLRGQIASGPINIAGVDDVQGRAYGDYKYVPEKELLSRLPRERFTLLLKHRPAVDGEALGLFDLQLSGHTHKGQIFPFSIVTWLYYPVHAGSLTILDGLDGLDGCQLYVSRGSGTWGPPVRVLSPPEVTVIDLMRTP